MTLHSARLIYPKDKFRMILQSSFGVEEFYGVDEFEQKKLNIIQNKYGCRHCFHQLPDDIRLNLNEFIWNEECQCFQIIEDRKVEVQLNRLEETILEYITG